MQTRELLARCCTGGLLLLLQKSPLALRLCQNVIIVDDGQSPVCVVHRSASSIHSRLKAVRAEREQVLQDCSSFPGHAVCPRLAPELEEVEGIRD